MPWRLIGILLILILFLIFSGFNVHKVTIYFGPFTITDIPLFVVIMFAYILGAFTALPFAIITSYKKKKKIQKENKIKNKETHQISENSGYQTMTPEKNGFEDKKKKSKIKKK